VVTVSDSFKGVDYMCKSPSKVLSDVGKGADAFGRIVSFHVVATDVGRGADYFGRTVFYHRVLADVGRVADYFVRAVHFVKSYSDVFRGGDWMSKGVGKALHDWAFPEYLHVRTWIAHLSFADAGVVSDWMFKELGKRLADVVVAREVLGKDVVKAYVDASRASDVAFKEIGKYPFDSARVGDWIVKASVKVFREAVVGVDVAGKGIVKPFADSLRVSDWMFKEFGKRIVESVRVGDWTVKMVVKAFRELGIVSDLLAMGKVVTVKDVFYGEHAPVIVPAKELRDTVRVSDWMSKDLVKMFREIAVVRDAPYRTIAIVLRDKFVDEGYVTKHPSLAERDEMLMRDLATKVAFKLAGKDVRRVYFFPPELQALWDIIMAEDHNVKVDVAKILIDAFRRVKEKLGG
jgi:hypothetical protein